MVNRMARIVGGALLSVVLIYFLIQYVFLHNEFDKWLGIVLLTAAIILFISYQHSMLHRGKVILGTYTGDEEPKMDLFRIRRHGWTWIIPYWMPPGVTVTRFQTHAEAIEQWSNCSFMMEHYNHRWWAHFGTRPLPVKLPFAKGYHWKEWRQRRRKMILPDQEIPQMVTKRRPKGGIQIWMGTSQWGTLWANLAELPHLMIGGTTFAGKSVFMRSLLTQICLGYPPSYVKLALADLKGNLEFNVFTGLPHLMGRVRGTWEEYAELVADIEQQIHARFETIHQSGFEDMETYNSTLPEGSTSRLPYIILVIDEFARLQEDIGTNTQERQDRRNILARTSEFAAIGRAVGVHLVIATQRPDAKVFPGDLKANFPATVALRVKNGTNSQILLDNALAASLPVTVRGRAFFQWDRETMFQIPLLLKQDARALLDPLRTNTNRPLQEPDESEHPQGALAPVWAEILE